MDGSFAFENFPNRIASLCEVYRADSIAVNNGVISI